MFQSLQYPPFHFLISILKALHVAVSFLGRKILAAAATSAASALIPELATGLETTGGPAKIHVLHSVVFPTVNILGSNRAIKFSANKFL